MDAMQKRKRITYLFEEIDEKIKIMDDFINKNKNEFKSDNLSIIGKLKK